MQHHSAEVNFLAPRVPSVPAFVGPLLFTVEANLCDPATVGVRGDSTHAILVKDPRVLRSGIHLLELERDHSFFPLLGTECLLELEDAETLDLSHCGTDFLDKLEVGLIMEPVHRERVHVDDVGQRLLLKWECAHLIFLILTPSSFIPDEASMALALRQFFAGMVTEIDPSMVRLVKTKFFIVAQWLNKARQLTAREHLVQGFRFLRAVAALGRSANH